MYITTGNRENNRPKHDLTIYVRVLIGSFCIPKRPIGSWLFRYQVQKRAHQSKDRIFASGYFFFLRVKFWDSVAKLAERKDRLIDRLAWICDSYITHVLCVLIFLNIFVKLVKLKSKKKRKLKLAGHTN